MSALPVDLALLVVGVLGGYFAARFALRSRTAEVAYPTSDERGNAPDDSFERLLRELPVAALLIAPTGHLAFANPRAAEVFGFDAARNVGRQLIEAIPSVDLERLVSRALSGERVLGTVILRPAGGEATIGITAIPAATGGAIVVGEDRTKVVAVERVRRDFLADVSHELRTPISSIRLMVETIELTNGDPEAIRIFLPQALTELERMTRLVEDLLDLARSESGQVQLERAPVDLRELATGTLDTFAPRAHSLAVDLSLAPGVPVEAEIDPERITQVIVNLVDNALRHTPANGHVLVSVTASADDAYLTVQDDGIGIPFKDQRHVFERFYVVDRSRSRESGGTGLGLAIVKQIVEGHGGEIIVESELGAGAKFACRIPLRNELAKRHA